MGQLNKLLGFFPNIAVDLLCLPTPLGSVWDSHRLLACVREKGWGKDKDGKRK